jgi:predicted dinucleotide-binding enzyme
MATRVASTAAEMKIAVIGAGNIGGNLTRRLTALGHDVTVANSRGPETLAELAAETGATAAAAADAAAGAELVIVTIPTRNTAALAPGLLDAASPGAVVIDTNNYYPKERDGLIEEIEAGATESRYTADRLGRPVVKAFNGIYAAHLLTHGRAAGAPDRIALPIAGDDPAAKATVSALVDELGFEPVDAGTIDESWRQQPGTPSYGFEGTAAELRAKLAEASPQRPPSFRA